MVIRYFISILMSAVTLAGGAFGLLIIWTGVKDFYNWGNALDLVWAFMGIVVLVLSLGLAYIALSSWVWALTS